MAVSYETVEATKNLPEIAIKYSKDFPSTIPDHQEKLLSMTKKVPIYIPDNLSAAAQILSSQKQLQEK